MTERIKFKSLLLDLIVEQDHVTVYRLEGDEYREAEWRKRRDATANKILEETNLLQNRIEILEVTISDIY
jgi:hypothetical protein